MVFNDVFDVAQDTVERPGRPIPSGAVSLKGAWTLGLVLCAGGLGLSAMVGVPGLTIGGLIVVAIFGYDWLLKKTPIAPLAMGLCRFLNVMLGASLAGSAAAMFAAPQVLVAGCLGVYIAGLTWFARHEAIGDNKADLVGGTAVMNLGIVGLAAVAYREAGAGRLQVIGLLLFILAVINVRLFKAIRSGDPPDIGAGIRTALLSLVLIDASLVLALTGSVFGAVLTASLLLPASLIRRWIPLT
jgi:4-hydroxybenzoate polyprenyltransferase